jgi:hypothetical protein
VNARQLAGLAVVAVLVAACGGEPEAARSRMDGQTAQLLAADAAAVRSAADLHDRAGGERALTKLTRDVAQAQARGRLSAEKAQTILAAGSKIAEDFQAMPMLSPGPIESTGPGRMRKNDRHGNDKHGKHQAQED